MHSIDTQTQTSSGGRQCGVCYSRAGVRWGWGSGAISVVLGHREGASLAAGDQSIAGLSSRTAADGEMRLGFAAGASCAFADARIDALVVDAGPVVWALVVAQALAL